MSALPYDIGVDSGDPFGFNGSVDYTANIVDLNSAGLASSFTFPPPFSSLSMSLAWPNLTTNGGVTPASPDMLSSTRASNNFPRLNPDVDQALTDILFGGINPFDVNTPFVAGDAHIELADLDLNGGLNFIQAFALKEPGLTGLIRFENGASQTFTFGSDILLPNASSY